MPIDNLPEDWTEVGRIEIVIGLSPEGTGTAYDIDGIDAAAAIGHMMIALDAMREDQKSIWARPPGGFPLDGDYDEEEEYDDD